ncbi:hypothetical protein Mycch_3185 [Mycolicibacterium chubuense NBB4]|uniref:Uncharacterized protein n=1 Tax=Mycolicibacterium chubuense (strain NBB4) TaxID=710421 RepID=I4BKX7_MYCCN|nr:hypothetical protein [Mycolicibacterium chubuense]AFM17934.1 hypothetical protein Mycch_3185 [Mycolicibacterium chubuense NBB4]
MSDFHGNAGGARRRHSEVAPELRALAQSILDKLDPAVRLAAARAQGSSPGSPGRCQQVWCPMCALAALISGEQHPLLGVVAEHSVALLTVIKALVDNLDDGSKGPQPPGPGGPSPDEPPPTDPGGPTVPPAPSPPGRYEHIPVTVEE